MLKQCIWKSEEEKVSEEYLVGFISRLIEAEQQRWIEAATAVETNIEDEITAQQAVDPGWNLLGHGKLIKTIHRYFQNLEPHRYCLSLTSNTRKPNGPKGKIRVVHASQDSTPQTSSHLVTENRVTSSLDGEFNEQSPEFELYEKAVLCARLPVLGIPPLPSPYSPESSPKSPTQGAGKESVFSFDAPNSNVFEAASAEFPNHKRATICVTPETIVPIDSHALSNLVRESFKLSRRRHLYYENLVINHRKPKDLERALVEELITQLSLLERNLHPFYGVQAFMDKNAYSEWLLLEKERIHLLIKSFWRSSLPPLPALPVGYKEKHKDYKQLMILLIRHESQKTGIHTRFGDVVPAGPLSPLSCRLLKEFSRRYGVGELYCRIVYLYFLAEHFENEIWYINHVTVLLKSTMEICSTNQEILVKEEFLLLLEAITLLLKHAKNSLTRIKRLFADKLPQGGVSSLLVMLESVLEAKMTLKLSFSAPLANLVEAQGFQDNEEEQQIDILLTSFIETEIDIRYERYKMICMDELNAHSIKTTASPQLLNLFILNARDEVKDYQVLFQQDFAKYFDIVNLAAVKYYRLLMEDVEEVCSNPSQDVQDDEIDLQVLSLAFRLSGLDQDWSKYIPVRMQTWRILFQRLSKSWLDALGYHMKHMVTMIIRRDPWTTLTIANCSSDGQLSSTSCPIRRKAWCYDSNVGRSLTPSENSAFSSVRSLLQQSLEVRDGRDKSSEESSVKTSPLAGTEIPSFYRDEVASISDEKDLGKYLTVQVDVHKVPEQKSKHQKIDKQEHNSNTDCSNTSANEVENDPVRYSEENAFVTGQSKPNCDYGSQVCESSKPVAESRVHCSSSGHHTPYQNGSDSDSNDEVTNSNVNNRTIYLSDSFDFVEDQLVRKENAIEDTAASEDVTVATNLSNNVNQTKKTLKICDSQQRCAGTCTKRPLDTTEVSVAEIEEIATVIEQHKHKCLFKHKPSQRDLDVTRTSPEVAVFSAENNKRSPQACQDVQLGSETSSIGNYQSCDSSQGSFKSRSDYISFTSSETMCSTNNKSDESTDVGLREDGRKHFSCARRNGSHDFQQTRSGPANVEPRQKVFPFSSSLIDLICSINRLVAFSCHLCKILCSNEKTQRSDTGYVTCANDVEHERMEQSEQVKKELCYKLVQVVCTFIEQYSDNLLGLDTCGLSDELLLIAMDEPLREHFKAEEAAGRLVSCGYHCVQSHECNTSLSVDLIGHHIPSCEALLTAINPGGCELMAASMGIRITDVIVLRRILPWLQDHIISCLQNPNILASNAQPGDCRGVRSESYCQYGPCPDGSAAARSSDWIEDADIGNIERVRECGEHLARIEKAQLVLTAYRMNMFVKRVIRSLLELNLPNFDIKKRLLPATEFLESKLKMFNKALYPNCFNQLLTLLWHYLLQDFMEECRHLRDVKAKAYEQAKLLLQAISHMMQFFHGSEEGLPYDVLSSTSETLSKIVGLYTNTTERLISLFNWLRRQIISRERESATDDCTPISSFGTSASGRSRAHAPADSLLQSMRKELHATRKCFSGNDLVAWVVDHVQKEGYDSLGVCIGSTDIETGMEIGQYLLDNKLIVCIALPPNLDDSSSLNSTDIGGKRVQQDPEGEEEGEGEGKGSVLVEEEQEMEITINEIAVAKPRLKCNGLAAVNEQGAAVANTSSSRNSETHDAPGSGTWEFLDSVGSIFFQSISVAEHSVFDNNPNAFYRFMREEDTNGSDNVKLKLNFLDRLNARELLLEIICVLYTRKDVEPRAKVFLKQIQPHSLVTEAVGKEKRFGCFAL